jgi:hypothetical protein
MSCYSRVGRCFSKRLADGCHLQPASRSEEVFPSAEEVWDAFPKHKREVLFSKFLARIDGQAEKFMGLFESVAYWNKNKAMAMREQSPT